jgi:hypothetical protein
MNEVVRSRLVRLVAVIAAFGVAAPVAIVVSRFFSDRQAASASLEARRPSETARTTPVVQVGEGTLGQARWSFRAYLGENLFEGALTEAICMEFAFPAGSAQDDFNCLLDYKSHIEVGPVGPIAFFSSNDRGAPPSTVFFGMDSSETASVTVTREDGKTYPVDLYGPYPELDNLNGFVAFVPPGQRSAQLAGYSETGDELWARSVEDSA